MYDVIISNNGIETTIHSSKFNDVKLDAGSVKIGINTADSFNLTISPFNASYNELYPLKTLVKIKNMLTNKYIFEGRVLSPTESMEETGAFSKSFICESELGFLNDSRQRHGEYHDITVRDFLQVIINNHNNDVANDEIDKQFQVGIVDVDSSTGTLYRYLGYESTFDAIENKLIKRLGGELRVRKVNGVRYLDYVRSVGEFKQTEIRLSKNLKSLTKEIDPSEVITRLIPLGERISSEDEDATDASEARLTIADVNDGKDFIVDESMEQAIGTIVYGEQTWDDITQPSILKTRGQQWLHENNRMKVQHKLSALDLSIIGLDTDDFEVGNWYPVINPIMNINESLRVIQMTIDILEPEKNDLTIGDKFINASQYQSESNQSQKKIVRLESIVDRQTQRIASIRTELKTVDNTVEQLQQALADADIPELEGAVSDLVDAVANLTDAVDNIPDYDLATQASDGLMSKEDKAKLDRLIVTATTDIDSIRNKLELITVDSHVDLNDMLERIETLENN